MRLEAVTLHGFKSFAEKSVIKVLPGITGIVGPNGCGKSNVSEGIRWALGEQSAKSLRGQRMEDLIFHGSASRKPIGMAEVELTFSNDGTVAVPWTEIAVSRRLYRTGESEYLINKTGSRLRDIFDLFAGTGANPRAYSVMDQDKLNHVLTAKPHERRIFIEEAAGIARYKQQRHETEGKLDATRHNLVRVRDVMEEVRRQLTSLERQARRATQYKALQAERRDLALALLAGDYAALSAEAARVAAELVTLRDQEHALRAHAAQLAAREASQRAAIQESDHRLSDLRQAVQKVQTEVERLLERREQLGIQMREVADEVTRLDDDMRQSRERLGGIARDRESAGAALRDAEAQAAERASVAADLERALDAQRAALAEDRGRLESQRHEQIRLATERTDLMRSAGELRERHVQLTRRAERLAGELAVAESEAVQLDDRRADIDRTRGRVALELASLGDERARLSARLDECVHLLADAERELAERRLELAARTSSLTALRELARAREGYGAGVRALFARDEADGEGAVAFAGLVGTVADLLDVPAGLERAVEAVLGERLQWVVVQRFEHARAAVAYLQREAAGSATFIPLEHLPPPLTVLPDDNGVRWVARSVTASTTSLVHYLLGQVAVVDHLDHAEALWRRNGVVATYVTLAGEVLGPTGRLRGGSDGVPEDGDAHSLLARKRRIRELDEEVATLAGAVAAAEASASALRAETAELRERLAALDDAIQVRQAEKLTGDKDLEQVVREHERVHRHGETVRMEATQVDAEAAETTATLEQLERRIVLARDAEARHESLMTDLRGAIDAAQTRETALGAELTACRVDLASLSERVEALSRERVRLDQMEADLTERLQQAQTRQVQLTERMVHLAEDRERTDVAAREGAEERNHREAALRVAVEAHEALLAELAEVETAMRTAHADTSRLTAATHALDLAATEGRVRREEMMEEAHRAYGVDEPALLACHDPDRDLASMRARHDELAAKIEAIGAVNLVADDEYRELDERLAFLRTQHDDLTASVKDLEKALRGMTRTAQERFTEAFEKINDHFREIFGRLFEGGRAELRLVEAEEGGDPLDTGVELMAQPRGKRLQSSTLMSGGERALTGLALLFAIFYFRPSPFCVLDEVDAPLDDANIYRFLRVLRELTSQTQFLVITHNRKTMEATDVLYGVTMEEPGLSKLVSVNLGG